MLNKYNTWNIIKMYHAKNTVFYFQKSVLWYTESWKNFPQVNLWSKSKLERKEGRVGLAEWGEIVFMPSQSVSISM